MANKISKAIVIVSFIVLLISIVVVFSFSYSYFNDLLEDEIQSEVAYISQSIDFYGVDYLNNISPDENTRITLISPDGTVVFDSKNDHTTLENHGDREEILQAFETGNGQSSRYSTTMAEKTIYYATLMQDGNVLRVSSSSINLMTLLISMLAPIIFILVLAVALSLVLAKYVSKLIVKPLNNIDFNNLQKIEVYSELEPFVEKINNQNYIIKQQIKTLERKQCEFNTITSNMNEGLIIIDEGAEILSYNKSALDLLGADPDGKYKSVLALNRSTNFRKTINSSLMGKRTESIIHSGENYYRVIANPVNHTSITQGAVILILDETQKEKNETIRREFTANLSHELKTPLTSISGFAELIKNGMVSHEDCINFSGKIYSEAQLLIALVNDIIKLSKLDEGAVLEKNEKLNLGELSKDICNRLALVASSRDIILTTNCQDRYIKGNRKIIDEIIYNLCDNAIKYNKDGGVVKISVTGDEKNTILSVTDSGIGIPKEVQDRVFERFFRVDKSHSKEVDGTGLGLSIVKHGAIYHNAKITLKSEQGQGTTVTIAFDNDLEKS